MWKRTLVLCSLLLCLQSPAAEERKSLVDGIWIGPNITLMGLITPFRLGVEVRLGDSWMVSYDYGFLPRFYLRLLTQQSGDIPEGFALQTHYAGARWRPWKGAFHVGVLVGLWTVTAPTVAPPTPTEPAYLTSSNISQIFLAPTIGWRWTIFNGVFLGIDLGWQFKLALSGTYTIFTGPGGSAEADQLRETMDRLQNSSLPLITVLKLGYNF